MKERRKIGYLILVSSLLVITFTLASAVNVAPGAESVSLEELELAPVEPSRAEAPSKTPVTEISSPARLRIPKLEIDAKVLPLGLTVTGNMDVPSNFVDVSWYMHGARPGEQGTAVLAGHEDNAISLDGVFKHLEDLEKGDSVYVEGQDGEMLQFEVIGKQIYPYNLIGPELERIFHDDSGKYMNLITCAGDWLKEARTNDQRLVVFTRLVDN